MNNLEVRLHSRAIRRSRWSAALLFALALALACFVGAQAAVVEADDVVREVDSATGVQEVTGLGAPGTDTDSGPLMVAPGPGGRPPQEPEAGPRVTPEELPAPSPTPGAIPPRPEGGSILGYVLVGLIVVVVGTVVVLVIARNREQGR